jgi:hypothetical protein
MITTALSNILKLFLPSWNFFNDFSTVPRLDVRIINDSCESEWRPLYTTTPTQSIRRVLFNAEGNAELLEKTFIDRAAEEISPKCGKHQEILTRIVRSRLSSTQPTDEFQFRLVMTSPGEQEKVLFVSARLSAQEEAR